MADEVKVNIPYKKENIIKCLCPTCPVQEHSTCAKEKMMNYQNILQSEDDPKPEDYPGMYCTNGNAVCKDLDTEKNCICNECMVYKEFGLENAHPNFLFCGNGKAKK